MSKMKMNIPLSRHTTFRIGGPARYYTEPKEQDAFKEAVSWALSKEIPFFILGGGSNVLFHDRGFDGLVINTKRLARLLVEGERVNAECGVPVDELVDACTRHGLSGVEFAAGLPGTVGGALYMNARAYERSFSQIVEEVFVLEVEGKRVREQVLAGSELKFDYKKSVFQHGKIFVQKVTFRLSAGSKDAITRNAGENREKRREMGQYLFPNAGCIFKNNYEVGILSGKIIEELGLKGKRIGDAEVYDRHANFIINRGKASARDVYNLIRFIEDEVAKKKGITLEREILLVGDWNASEIPRRRQTPASRKT